MMQQLLLLIAPALFAASIYMILGRLIRTLRAEHLAIVRAAWITRVFVAGDILSFVLQGTGSGIMAGGQSLQTLETGENVIIGGLIVQIVVLGFFVITAVMLHWRCAREAAMGRGQDRNAVHWRRHLYVLYGVSGLIMTRSVFRVEYVQGNDGYLMSHEEFFYLCDTLLMTVIMSVFLIWYVDDVGRAARRDEDGEQGSRDVVHMPVQMERQSATGVTK